MREVGPRRGEGKKKREIGATKGKGWDCGTDERVSSDRFGEARTYQPEIPDLPLERTAAYYSPAARSRGDANSYPCVYVARACINTCARHYTLMRARRFFFLPQPRRHARVTRTAPCIWHVCTLTLVCLNASVSFSIRRI